ncbi:MAG: DNA-3-methyladenine glycosylase [Candidatus Aenigmarchaeota archaeon]|nr:DNA-3-methyladenine glycosylase [Candidatus Aenigmarchaeota archaeon]
MRLCRNFYSRSTLKVAKGLLGKVLVHKTKFGVLKGRIVETEAYLGDKDPGSHAFRKITPRNKIMFGMPGFAYVYFTYGNHWLMNVVTEKEGVAGTVLLRALEPIKGIEIMKKNRNKKDIRILTNGPGKLTQAMMVGKKHNGIDVTKGELFIEDSKTKPRIHTTTRIGIKTGANLPYRFYVKDSVFVSKK